MARQTAMVLGALRDEVPLVEFYKSLGFHVVVVGLGSDYPCCAIADTYYDVDICDKEKILEIAKKHNISAIASNVVSIAGEKVAWVAERLNLPTIGSDVAMRFLNKAIMREMAQKGGVHVPPFKWVKTVEEAFAFADEHEFPLIIKPVNGNSSKGVYRVDDVQELKERFMESYSCSVGKEGVIIEGFIEGEEYIVDAYTYNGACFNTDIAYKQHFSIPDRFISRSVVIQDADHCVSHIEHKLLLENKKAVEALGLPFGPTHGEYIYNKAEDSVYLVEVAARGGGVRLASDLIPLATGIDVNRSIGLQSLGQDPLEGSSFELTEGAAGWFAFALKEGNITALSGFDEAMQIDGVVEIDMKGLAVGEKSRPLIDDGGKYGPIIIKGRDRVECYEIFDRVKLLLSVEINGDRDGILWG